MENKTFDTGVELASGKAKGAVGVSYTLRMCQNTAKTAVFDDGERCFTDDAVAQIDAVRECASKIWGDVRNQDFSAAYTIIGCGSHQNLMYGNVWIEIGKGYAVSLHWEAVTGLCQRSVETAVLRNGHIISEEPIRFDLRSEDGPAAVAEWTRTLMTAIGRGAGPYNEEAAFAEGA
jgi:hypothetical protein